jgi:hypothetical protein
MTGARTGRDKQMFSGFYNIKFFTVSHYFHFFFIEIFIDLFHYYRTVCVYSSYLLLMSKDVENDRQV